MGKRLALTVLLVVMVVGVTSPAARGLEKVRLAYTKMAIEQELFTASAEEQGFWSANGLEANVSALAGGGRVGRALAAASVDMGVGSSSMALGAAAGGVPLWLVSDIRTALDFRVWVRADSRFKVPQDLKGASLGITRRGGVAHAYALAAARLLGLEGQVKIVATGGLREALAALLSGAVDARVSAFSQMVQLKLEGKVRDIESLNKYLPKEWTEYVIVAHKDFARNKPQVVKRAIGTLFQGIDFLKRNRDWTVGRLTKVHGYSAQAAGMIYDEMLGSYSPEGVVSHKGLENVKNFFREYGVLKKDVNLSELIWPLAKR